MRTDQKLYQILEKAHIDTKIAVEIQDWIVDTIEEKRDQGFTNMQETKILPMYQEVRTGFDSIRYELNLRFESMQSTMDARFESIDKRLDSINFTIRILGIPIVGATIGGLGVIFLQIYERLFG
ncbi:hypothetical protein [Leptospira limi]|uniref:DUF1640 domain-containing protein n=1 Tax=Leptospira limi TaxID=2950023 RepID=A0ABT3M0J7_9LEPT|nr:hypothetical protein [Leptospira limi]MCW7463491.1 hypothetical protein [Leptospira limi]